MKKVYYIGFYDTYTFENEKRSIAPAGRDKMEYIAKAIEKTGYCVEIISPTWTANKMGKFPRRTIKVSENITLTLCSTFGARNKVMKLLRKYIPLFWLFITLLFRTDKTDKVLVYHSLDLMWPIYLAKRIKKFKLILEVEEIYQDVTQYGKITKKMEYKMFNVADKYLFSNDMLNGIINPNNKPYNIIYGTYHVEKNKRCKFEGGKIHVVYAGTFDPRKGGSLAASAATHLPENYHLHIIGFGSDTEKEDMKTLINKISSNAKCTITYDGLLRGEEYIRFLQNCDIGLSTQIPEAAYNETSFPSKILSYMANGLRVVSIRIKAIEMSEVGQAVFYYEEPTPEAIANAIISIDINEPYDSRELIRKLDEDFVRDIKKLVEG